MSDTEVPRLVRVQAVDGVGRLTLDRPRAINALNQAMIDDVAAALARWRDDESVRLVLIDGAGERGLCAGGDVREISLEVAAGHPETADSFFRSEYTLNAQIAEYPKPIVVFADGITMGGGIGLAGHASVRVVTERSKLAMPETRIGFTPDVGGTFLLSRAPGRTGEFLGLTGTTMDAADAIYAGFADVPVDSTELPALADALQARATDEAIDIARSFASNDHHSQSHLASSREWIDDAFAAPTVSEIIGRLHASGHSDAQKAADTLGELSPTSLTVTLGAIRRARELPDLRAVLAQEYALAAWFTHTQPDFVEGIRAQLVDKDRSPAWQPATLADLPAGLGDTALASVPARPLWS